MIWVLRQSDSSSMASQLLGQMASKAKYKSPNICSTSYLELVGMKVSTMQMKRVGKT